MKISDKSIILHILLRRTHFTYQHCESIVDDIAKELKEKHKKDREYFPHVTVPGGFK